MYITVDKHDIEITHDKKVLFPTAHITKGELAHYYKKIGSYIHPYIYDRPLVLRCFPNGIDQEGFFKKNMNDTYPPFFITKKVAKKSEPGTVNYVLGNNTATLVYAVQIGMIEPHAWLSSDNKLAYPDKLIFDLDPGKGLDFRRVQWTAHELKKLCDQLQLPSYVMSTGSRGLHVIVPLIKEHTYEYTRSFARTCAHRLIEQYPDKLTIDMHKKKRGKRVFIDILRNAFGQTGIAPYGVRAQPHAPIATPVTWREALHPQFSPQKYTIKNIFRRLARIDNPWDGMQQQAVSLKNISV